MISLNKKISKEIRKNSNQGENVHIRLPPFQIVEHQFPQQPESQDVLLKFVGLQGSSGPQGAPQHCSNENIKLLVTSTPKKTKVDFARPQRTRNINPKE